MAKRRWKRSSTAHSTVSSHEIKPGSLEILEALELDLPIDFDTISNFRAAVLSAQENHHTPNIANKATRLEILATF